MVCLACAWKARLPTGDPPCGEQSTPLLAMRTILTGMIDAYMCRYNGLVSKRQTFLAKHNPGDDFALLHHRAQTLRRRFQALFFAPLVGIDRLTGFDTHEHPLGTLLGRGYHSSPLHQFLGQLERVGAAEALMSTLLVDKAGQLIYVD